MKILATLSNYAVHLIVPLFAIFDWILFTEHGKVSYKQSLIFLAYPLLYLVFILIRAEVGGKLLTGSRYPYPFIDFDVIGIGYGILVVIGLLLAFTLLGLFYVFLDKKLAMITKEKESSDSYSS